MNYNKKKSIDRRITYTRKVICDAFITLLNQNPIEKISVTKICKLADINRSTFYLHYADVTQVFNELEEKAYLDLVQFIERSMKDDMNRNSLSNELYAAMKSNPTLSIISKNSNILNQRIIKYSKSIIIDKCIRTYNLTQREAEIWAIYMINGAIAASLDVFENNYQNLVSENAFIDKIIQYGYTLFDKKTLD